MPQADIFVAIQMRQLLVVSFGVSSQASVIMSNRRNYRNLACKILRKTHIAIKSKLLKTRYCPRLESLADLIRPEAENPMDQSRAFHRNSSVSPY